MLPETFGIQNDRSYFTQSTHIKKKITVNRFDLGTLTNSLLFCNQFLLLSLDTQTGTDSKYLSRSALKEIKLVDRQEFELKWKLQNVAINHYFIDTDDIQNILL